ncbi:Lrp/AsnC family transcriptional regulator [Phytomonospora endophytica]|uniref:Lrp/AsnC family leucine-responsive transcriptional regulator n=1 Tax=Phytomonospora endophytica TaxID=714109 RepID=A0A841FZY0_9ACTN|nr:Lrp/AsnC family transcriptional regulator [Phytomonospora endophytica]MBB6037480.1 Lrp/AsnC family leucine-responsive transcriptional regulator [Phytomonospora endophytica]GIG70730.1 AsnC family transcriptional regulator [Phytomonospora endophytica]
MDDIDRRLLEMLRVDGRRSYAELARQVGLSAPAVHDRMGRLERNGVITGYRAEVNPEAVGLGVTALIGIQERTDTEYSVVTDALEQIPEVESCYFLAGEESFLIKVRVGAIGELEQLVNRLNRLPGVARTRTAIALSTKWEARPQPLGTPREE